MTLIKSNKFPMGSLFSDFFGNDSLDRNFFDLRWKDHIPAVNVKENDTSYLLEVASPGMEKEDFDISIDNNSLVISAEKSSNIEEKEDDYVRKEFSYNSFKRTFALPEFVKEDDIKANYEKGVLFITIPKMVEEEVKKVKKSIAIL